MRWLVAIRCAGWSFMLILASSAAISAAGRQAASLRGAVTDASGGALPGVVVVATDAGAVSHTTVTDARGGFAFDGLGAGPVLVTASLEGFRDKSERVTLVAGAPIDLPLVLELAGLTEQVTVTAARAERALADVPSSVGVIAHDRIESARTLNLAEMLNDVPGVSAGNVSGVDDLRISIRGAGIRSSFGSRGIILLDDGVPVTEPDGQTPHFDGQIDLASAERIEIVKGPSSAVYGGAALGGVVNVVAAVPGREPRADVRVELGSYEFGKVHGSASGAVGPVVLSGTLGFTHLDGFREHNRLENVAGTARADWARDRTTIMARVLFTDAELDLPGSLDREQFEADPGQTRPIFVQNDWGRDNRLARFGARLQHQLGDAHFFEFDSYGQVRDLFHPIFVVIDQDARRYLGHARYRFAGRAHVLSLGLDFDRQWVDDRWFVNTGGEPGFQIRDDDNRLTNVGLYAQEEIDLGDRVGATLGLRYDRITYDLVDRLLFDGDASDRRVFERVSPKLGVVVRPGGDLTVYGAFATGFEVPTLGEVRLPAGFNADVRPQRATNVEGGVRGRAGLLDFDVSAYWMPIRDEILPVTVNEVTVYRNIARTSHTGIEAVVESRLGAHWQIHGGYAWSRFVLEELGAFSGNRLPGIPSHAGTVRGVFTGGPWDAALGLTLATETWVNDANDEAAEGYAVLSGSAGRQIGRVRIFVRADNLTDTRYTNRVQVNDSGGFFYYPATGRNASAGLQVEW